MDTNQSPNRCRELIALCIFFSSLSGWICSFPNDVWLVCEWGLRWQVAQSVVTDVGWAGSLCMLGGKRDLAGTMSHLLMSLASGTLHFVSREGQSGPACRKTNLLQMKMACLFFSGSHLNGSVNLDICCVCSLFWACTDGWFAWPSFPEVSSASDQMFILPLLRLCSFLLLPKSWSKATTDIIIKTETVQSSLKWHTSSYYNISAVNCAERSSPHLLLVSPNTPCSCLCICRHKR